MEVILYDGFLMFSVRVRFVSFPLPEHPFQAARLPFQLFYRLDFLSHGVHLLILQILLCG